MESQIIKKQQLLSSTGAQKYQPKWNLFIENRKMKRKKTNKYQKQQNFRMNGN